MPACVTRIIRARKSHRKAAKVAAWPPTSLSDEAVESRVQRLRVYRRPERFLLVVTESNDRFSPRCRVVGIASGVAPQDGAAHIGKLPRKGPVYSDKSILNELLYPCVAQRMRFVIVGRHDHPHIGPDRHCRLVMQGRGSSGPECS